jgi:SAM-dependent methyltransferase
VVAHPLVQRLTECLRGERGRRVLDFGTGSGRNAAALRDAGFAVIALDDAAAASDEPLIRLNERVAAVLSTHGLLHGTAPAIAARVRAVATALEDGGWLCATFGSSRDARFGKGERINDSTYAPISGDERGVAHTYFSREELRALLEPQFAIESLTEHGVDRVAGSWAHQERPLTGAVHWFVIARKR